MRYAELSFLVLLVLYHLAVLLPRHRRPFALNYLVFLAGIALGISLGLEGLRWQLLPPTALLLIDLFWLFPTFSRLRGSIPRRTFWAALGRFLRFCIAALAFGVAVFCLALAVAFPLPKVPLTGGLTPSFRAVHFAARSQLPAVELRLWYPASGDQHPLPRLNSTPETWARISNQGGVPAYWQAYLEYLPSNLIRGGKLAASGTKYPLILCAVPPQEFPEDYGYLFEDLASRGFLVAALAPPSPVSPPPTAFSWKQAWAELFLPLSKPQLWLEPELSLKAAARGSVPINQWQALRQAMEQLDHEPGDFIFQTVDWDHVGTLDLNSGLFHHADWLQQVQAKAAIILGSAGSHSRQDGGLPELWIPTPDHTSTFQASRQHWILEFEHLTRADWADCAYLKPYLAFFGLKTRADGGSHVILRQYIAAYFQCALLGGDGSLFEAPPSLGSGIRSLRKN